MKAHKWLPPTAHARAHTHTHTQTQGPVREFIRNQVGLKALTLEHLTKPRLAGILTCEWVIPFTRAVTVELHGQISLRSEVHVMKPTVM